MIYTVTCNPSLDYIVSVRGLQLGATNRTESERLLPGGKGLNVSAVLNHLGIRSTALGFTAGFTGREIERRIWEQGVDAEFIWLEEGTSRINVKLKTIDGMEINGQGPRIPQEKLSALMQRLEQLGEGDMLVLAGSIPASVPGSLYRDIMERLQGRGVQVIVDATGTLLLDTLKYHPFLVKPNHHELGELFQQELHTREEVIPFARQLQAMGAENVLVSMSAQGAVLAAADGRCYEAPAPEGILVNAVGAGDSMVAGFLAGWLERNRYEDAFAVGVAAGSASAFSEFLAERREIEEVRKRVQVTIHPGEKRGGNGAE